MGVVEPEHWLSRQTKCIWDIRRSVDLYKESLTGGTFSNPW